MMFWKSTIIVLYALLYNYGPAQGELGAVFFI